MPRLFYLSGLLFSHLPVPERVVGALKFVVGSIADESKARAPRNIVARPQPFAFLKARNAECPQPLLTSSLQPRAGEISKLENCDSTKTRKTNQERTRELVVSHEVIELKLNSCVGTDYITHARSGHIKLPT